MGNIVLEKVISGGQTGADQGGLEAAEMSEVATGGTAPRGYRTDVGPRPDLGRRFGLKESRFNGYSSRTRVNVRSSTGTVVFGNPHSPGSRLTVRLCRELRKPCLQIFYPEMTRVSAEHELAQWCVLHCVEILNVAGNRENRNPGIQVFARGVVLGAIKQLRRVCIL